MSGMYNMVFGPSDHKYPIAKALLGDEYHIGRFRDVWLEHIPTEDGFDQEKAIVAIYTRNGGGNREDYADQIESMRSHPGFVSDEDDEFDSTYATFRFILTLDQVEERLGAAGEKATILALLSELEPINMSQRWRDALKDIGAEIE